MTDNPRKARYMWHDLARRVAKRGHGFTKASTAEALARGLFGAPAFVIGDELFWGDDRLEEALAWWKRAWL
jgi:hypothetical protein